MTWTATGQTELSVSIDPGTHVATITIPTVDWNGAETITFRATDPGACHDTIPTVDWNGRDDHVPSTDPGACSVRPGDVHRYGCERRRV